MPSLEDDITDIVLKNVDVMFKFDYTRKTMQKTANNLLKTPLKANKHIKSGRNSPARKFVEKLSLKVTPSVKR